MIESARLSIVASLRPLCRALGPLLLLASLAPQAGALRLEDRISPLNKERPRRARTRFIILHTTEGAPRGALQKLREYGEAHYLVLRDGEVLRIVDKDRVAYHAGRSMWGGHQDLDTESVGIEVVGYHNRPIRPAQIKALRELIRQLRAIYRVPASRVLTHAHVAYGAPNRYHHHRHRGRKRCGMNLATTAMRKKLGLGSGPAADPDVRAGRLRVADRMLYSRLYQGRDAPAPHGRAHAEGHRHAERHAHKHSPRRRAPRALPAGVLDVGGRSAERALGKAATRASTVYFFPDGMVRTGAELKRRGRRRLARLPEGTRALKGVRYAGYVKAGRPPSVLCGASWRSKKSWYRTPNGKLSSGADIRPARLPKATMAFCAG